MEEKRLWCVNFQDQDPLYFHADSIEVNDHGDLCLLSYEEEAHGPLIIFKRDIWLSCSLSDPESGKAKVLVKMPNV